MPDPNPMPSAFASVGLPTAAVCSLSAKCDNCDGPHIASLKDCPNRKKEAAIQHVHAESDISYADACCCLMGGSSGASTTVGFTSYSAVLAR